MFNFYQGFKALMHNLESNVRFCILYFTEYNLFNIYNLYTYLLIVHFYVKSLLKIIALKYIIKQNKKRTYQ